MFENGGLEDREHGLVSLSHKFRIHFVWSVDCVCIVLSGNLTIEHLANFSSHLDCKLSEQKEESCAYLFFYSHFHIGP